MTAQVGAIVLLSRRAGEPMRVRATVALGTGEVRWLPDPVTPSPEPPSDLADHIVARLTEALRPGVVHVAGSRRMGCALPAADVDLVAALPDDADVVARVREALPEAVRVRQVVGARVPGVRMHVSGLDVDLTVVTTGHLPPDQAVDRRAELGEAAAVALGAVSDADAVRTAVGPAYERFARLARSVKAWARAKGLDAAPLGGLPGLAWTVLAARTFMDAPDEPDLLHRFFSTWAAWNWTDPVTITPIPAEPPATPMTVLTPSAPVRNCARQVSIGGLDLLTQELYQAWELTETGRHADLPTPPPLHRRHAAWAVLTVRPGRQEDLDTALGRVRGRLLDLLATLEESGLPDVHAWPHPYERAPHHARYAIGLGRTPPTAASLTEITRRWTSALPGVTLERAEPGDVPTLTAP